MGRTENDDYMKQYFLKELEIIAFVGAILGPCGHALPIVKHRDSGDIFKLPIRKNQVDLTAASTKDDPRPASSILGDNVMMQPGRTYSEEEIKSLRAEEFLTMLSKPLPAKLDSVLVYITRTFLNAFGYDQPESLSSELEWQYLEGHKKEDSWVACASKQKIERKMNAWARLLMKKVTNELSRFFSSQDEKLRAHAEEMASLALYPACSSSLRASIYLRYGVAIKYSDTPERLDSIFELFISREFRDWTWESFSERMNRLCDLLHRQEARSLESRVDQASPEMIEKMYEEVRRINKIHNPREYLAECERTAQKFAAHKADKAQAEQAFKNIENIGLIYLDGPSLLLFAAEPAFYSEDVFLNLDDGPAINFVKFTTAVRKFAQADVQQGPYAEAVLAKVAGRNI